MMLMQWHNCETCKGEGTTPHFFGLINLTCPACKGVGGKDVEIPMLPAQSDLDFTKHNGEHKKVLRQEPYPNVAHF